MIGYMQPVATQCSARSLGCTHRLTNGCTPACLSHSTCRQSLNAGLNRSAIQWLEFHTGEWKVKKRIKQLIDTLDWVNKSGELVREREKWLFEDGDRGQLPVEVKPDWGLEQCKPIYFSMLFPLNDCESQNSFIFSKHWCVIVLLS